MIGKLLIILNVSNSQEVSELSLSSFRSYLQKLGRWGGAKNAPSVTSLQVGLIP